MGSHVNARFEHLFLAFENYCIRVNMDIPISQQPSCRSDTLVSGNVKIVRVFAVVPEKSDFKVQTTVGSRVMRASIELYAEVYALCVTN